MVGVTRTRRSSARTVRQRMGGLAALEVDVKIESMWVVNDPGPRSTIADICFVATPRDLLLGIVGAFVQGKERLALREAMSLYTSEGEARADGEERLAKRDAAAAEATP